MRYAVILAGGSGKRLWPLSRRHAPKQVCPLLDEETMLQKTYRRVRGGFATSAVLVSTTAAHAQEVARQLPELPREQLLIEPVARETAAAIGYAALRLRERDPEAMFVTIAADAHVVDAAGYLRAISGAFDAVERMRVEVVLVGVTPQYPETGYGYIELPDPHPTFGVATTALRFVEKPDRATAAAYVASGRYLWNPALFTFHAARLLERFSGLLPQHATALASLVGVTDMDAIAAAFAEMPLISIDCGMMEHLERLVVIPASFGWADIGHWRAVHDVLAATPDANVARAVHVPIESVGNLIIAPEGKVVVTCGLDDCVVIDTPDALLVCRRDRAQEVKRAIEELERRGLMQYL
ncbi:mannose-1-phosphate guanylyltransferase [Candidatus Uhrbacteria bacterium]|nr:mannose-1-phosphate guanylyltransferase [Candidatus Uhrbacteria bacterium]